jgi:hypothetical protein
MQCLGLTHPFLICQLLGPAPQMLSQLLAFILFLAKTGSADIQLTFHLPEPVTSSLSLGDMGPDLLLSHQQLRIFGS